MESIDGEQLRLAREHAGKTQAELAEDVGVSLRTVGNWERGSVIPRKHWARLGDIFGGSLASAGARSAARAERSERLGAAESGHDYTSAELRELIARTERVNAELSQYSASDLVHALDARVGLLERENDNLRMRVASLQMFLQDAEARLVRASEGSSVSQADVTLAAHDRDIQAEHEGFEEMP